MKQKFLAAFSLIELTVVMILIGILAVVIVPVVDTIDTNAKNIATQKEMYEIRRAILGDADFRGYVQDAGEMPSTLSKLTSAADTGYNAFTQSGGSRGYYLSQADLDESGTPDVLEDAWGTSYVWPSTGTTRTLLSKGKDKATGGGDDISVTISTT